MELSLALAASSLALLVIGGLALIRYRRWISDCTRRLEDGSTLIETRRGQVEYAISQIDGPVVLFVHGQPGGYDQGAQLAEAGAQRGYRMLRISRPGYLRTPLDVGRTPAEQADAMAAVLQALGIPRAAAVGLSGGGPAAIEFALRHPDQCAALLLVSAVSLFRHPPANLVGRLLSTRLLTSNFAGWLIGAAARRWPVLLAYALVPSGESRAAVMDDPRKLSILVELAQAGIQLPAQRRAGTANDDLQFASLPVLPVERIRAPTLVVHGTDDELVPFYHALFVAGGVPGAELCGIEGGTHAIFATHMDLVQWRLFDFLDNHAKEASDADLDSPVAER